MPDRISWAYLWDDDELASTDDLCIVKKKQPRCLSCGRFISTKNACLQQITIYAQINQMIDTDKYCCMKAKCIEKFIKWMEDKFKSLKWFIEEKKERKKEGEKDNG